MFDKLYEEMERATIHFAGYASEKNRYDFAIIFTEQFFGKPIVMCMQTGRSALLCVDDLNNVDYLQKSFSVRPDEAEELSLFLRQRLPSMELQDQY